MTKILIVDDEIEVAEATQYLIESEIDTISTTVALGGFEALEAINQESYDLIITDLKMPNMTGDEFLAEAKNILHDKLPPFIFVSGMVPKSVKERLENMATNISVLQKPYGSEEIINIINQALAS